MTAKNGLDIATTMTLGRAYVLAFAGAHAPAIALAAVGLWAVRRRVALAALAPCLVLTAIALGGAHAEGYPFQRYLFPLLPLVLVLAARGAEALLALGRPHGRLGVTVASAGLATLVAVQVAWRAAAPDMRGGRVLEAAVEAARRLSGGDPGPHDVAYPPYHRLSSWLRDVARPGQTIAAQEIGIVSYYSGVTVLDTFGLADAHIARTPGQPGGKAAPDYVFGRAPDYFAIRLAQDGVRPGLPADDVYASHGRMAFEYSLAQFFPDASSRRIALFVRRDALVRVASLQDRVPAQARFASATPPHIAERLTQLEPGGEEFAAAGRLHFKRWIEGVQWNPADPEGAATLAVDVPDTALPYFEATIAPPHREAGGEFVASVAPGDGVHEAAGRWSDTTGAPVARDVSIDLSKWRGRTVEVRLLYRPAEGSHAGSPGWLIWMEPRLVVVRSAPVPGAARTLPALPLDAVCAGQTVPNVMAAGQGYDVSVTMRNTGRRTWTAEGSHRLGSQNPADNSTWGPGRITLDPADSVAPGQQKTFTFAVTAPPRAGAHDFQWRMLQEGGTWFGAACPNVSVKVTATR